ncbi:MAG: maltooligosyl trehalose synthase [Dehalococcoidia bacterium]|nr:MAG: maltooligosyl trehalose synthase [Dehalococcoidia bacterium]
MTAPLIATYRVQLNPAFGFDEAAQIVPYLADLGVSHLYASPYLQAAPGSTHGYDVVDHTRVNEELGGEAGHARFIRALGDAGLGHILDIVPNHMAIVTPGNRWWWDVLENGPASRYAAYFDVDWDPPEAKLRNTVLLPILGDHYGRVLEAGELTLIREGGSFSIRYFEHAVPVAPRSLDSVLGAAARRAGSDELAFLADAFGALPLATATDPMSIRRRHRDKEVLRVQLARLLEREPAVAEALDEVVAEVNANPDALDAILERQNYRLAYWRTAGRELGYRRFFDINSLAGLRTESGQVFANTHQLILRWLDRGMLDGVRVDHIDGLRDPAEYLRRLREAARDAWIVVEKILEPGEDLPESWPIGGTTGYDFLNRVNGLFVDPAGEAPLTAIYAEFTGDSTEYPTIVREKKQLILRELLGSDVNRLTAQLVDICEGHRRFRDYTRHELHEALREVIACFPVYRTYVRAATAEVREQDVRYVRCAIEAAKANRPDLDPILFEFLADLVLLQALGTPEAEFAMRFQQLTGPAMAKGVEDTAFYTFTRFISLNEVGGDPSHFGISPDAFHRTCAETRRRWPETMLTTSTHDTKRSEDVRARLNLLSEIPEQWGEAVYRWAAHNERHKRDGWPDRNAEYLFYQTLVGAWPLETVRAVQYMEKASREAKVQTSWTAPNVAYEDALRRFVEAVLADEAFLADLEAFVTPLVEPGRINSLAQTLLKLTTPGVPDIYQGCDLWDLSLVDPDNRRPVDFARRRALLADLDGATPEAIWARIDEGLPKLWVIRQALQLRRRRPGLFRWRGAYEPLAAAGPQADHVVAFCRGGGALTVVPRLVLRLGEWKRTALELPPGRWTNVLTGDEWEGGRVTLARLLRRFPVALLEKVGEPA